MGGWTDRVYGFEGPFVGRLVRCFEKRLVSLSNGDDGRQVGR